MHIGLITGNTSGPELNPTATLHRAGYPHCRYLFGVIHACISVSFHAVVSGLIKAHVPGSSRTSGFNFSALRKGLKLVVNEPDQMTDAPSDVSYLYKVTCWASHRVAVASQQSMPHGFLPRARSWGQHGLGELPARC